MLNFVAFKETKDTSAAAASALLTRSLALRVRLLNVRSRSSSQLSKVVASPHGFLSGGGAASSVTGYPTVKSVKFLFWLFTAQLTPRFLLNKQQL